MYSSSAHIVTRCEWNTAFDSKQLAASLQTYISKWSTYKMQRIINAVFDRFCPDGQTMKIKKLAIDLGSINYENIERELPLRLKDALYNALYSLIMYPKNGDETLEVIDETSAQIHILKTFLLKGILPWNYQENYGSANQMMHSQLLHNRLELIQLIQEIGVALAVRKRIAWQFEETIIKKIIIGLEPNNHQQIIGFSEEFVKVQKEENILKTSTQNFKKNLWLWILNYLFVDRGTIFNKIAFVRSTISQIANHFNISYDILVELIETAIHRNKRKNSINSDFIAILKLLSEELHHKSYAKVKTLKQQESFWKKVVTYFSSASARNTTQQKNEFNELVINLSKLDATRFQKILLKVEQKPTHWEAILKDLIPAAIENLFIALAPSQSKNVLTQIEFLKSLQSEIGTKITPIHLYTFGVEFCVENQNTSVGKHDFLSFVIEKIAKKQQQSTFTILTKLLGTTAKIEQRKTSFIPLVNELKSLFQQEIATNERNNSAQVTAVIESYIEVISSKQLTAKNLQILEKKLLQWIEISPKDFWSSISKAPKTKAVTAHVSALISTYGTLRFLKKVNPEIATFLQKLEQILSTLISEKPKHSHAFRTIKLHIVALSFSIIWNEKISSISAFFTQLLIAIRNEKTIVKDEKFQDAIQLLLKHPKMKTIGFSVKEFYTIQQQYKVQAETTALATIIEIIQERQQQQKVAGLLNEIVRAKKIHTSDFQKHAAKIVAYVLPNGMQVRKELIAKFLKVISKENTTLTSATIQETLENCFWQTLVLYSSYNGNEQKFRALFEATILNTFANISSLQHVVFGTHITSHSKTKETQIAFVLEAISKNESKAKVATLLKDILHNHKVVSLSTNSSQKIILTYLLSDGEKLYKKLTEQLLKKLIQLQTTLSQSVLQNSVEDCFWETLTRYNSHKGNTSKFIELFEAKAMRMVSKFKTVHNELISFSETKNTSLSIPINLNTATLFERIEKAIKKGNTNVVIGKKAYTFSEIFILGLETSPKRTRSIIQQIIGSKKQHLQLQESISFEEFIVLISGNTSTSEQETYQAFQALFTIAKQFGNTQIMATITTVFWKETIAVIQGKSDVKKQLEKLIKITFDALSTIETLDLLTIVKYMQRNRLFVPNVLKSALLAHHRIFEAIAVKTTSNTAKNALESCIKEGKIDALISHVITQFTIPAWFQHPEIYTYEMLLNTLIQTQPLAVLKIIRSNQVSEIQLTKLSQTIQFATLIKILGKLYPLQKQQLNDLARLYESMAMISVTGISAKELQDVLSKKVWKAWQTSNWTLITHTGIWNEMLWETCGKKSMKTQDFVKAIQSIKMSLPHKLQMTFTSLFPSKKRIISNTIITQTKPLKQVHMDSQKTVLPNEGITIPNAGLVMLNSYFLMLFDRLGILDNKQFKTTEDQEDAVHYLQYIVTGQTQTEESLLVLNKVLAGLSPNAPVKNAIDMTGEQKQLIDGLINAAISYWPAIGETSIDGFRGNWLVREGILRETEERWELTVEKRAYDILMLKSPFSFSIIKLPWMEKPLHVTWPF